MEEAEKRAEEKGKDNKRVKVYKYIGKSAKSSFKRGKEHLGDRRALNLRSHMLKHAVDRHEGLDLEKVEFRMKVLQYNDNAFEGQVSESIKIRNNSKHHILNSKGEYNRVALPRLGLKMGTKEYSKAKDEEEKEEEKERNIEEECWQGSTEKTKKGNISTKEEKSRRRK